MQQHGIYYLSKHLNPSMYIKILMALGPKFCIQPRGVKIINTIRITDRFKRDVRLHDYLISNRFDEDDEIPRLHRRNEKWQTPQAIGPIEDVLKNIETSMYLETIKTNHQQISNLKNATQWFEFLEKE